MRQLLIATLVFAAGFAVMVLEIVGARLLAREFGSSLYVWTSQIGVVLIALAAGYYVGGVLGDRFLCASVLVWLLLPAGVMTFLVPEIADHSLAAIVQRHSPGAPIPPIWQKLDPALGSAAVFFLPCFALATLSPCLIRLASQQLTHVGRVSGLVFAASTAGGIVGVFASGYLLLEWFKLSSIFRGTGGLMFLLAALCLAVDQWPHARSATAASSDEPPGKLVR